MYRNFDQRVEVASVYNKEIQKELKKIIDIQLNDNVKGRIIDGSQNNLYKRNTKEKIRSQRNL